MSSATSAVTYTSVYTDSEPGRAFWGADDEEVSEGGIPRVIVLGYDGLPIRPVAPPSPDYIPGPENPQTPPVPQDEDEHEFLAEEQPLPGHVTESDPEEDPEEYEMMRTVGWDDANNEDDDRQDEDDKRREALSSLTKLPHCRITITFTTVPDYHASLYIPPPVDRRDDIPESEQPPRKRTFVFLLLEEAQGYRSRISTASRYVTRIGLMLAALRETDRRRSDQMERLSESCIDIRPRDESDIQLIVRTAKSIRGRARQPGPEARIPDHQDASGDPTGTEGVVGLTRWIEKMESVFNISGCAIENQVKFATCTLLGAALTWWNETPHLRERQSTTRRKADDSYHNNYGHQQHTLQEARMSANRTTIWGQAKEALWGILAQYTQWPSPPQWPVHPEVPQGADKIRHFCPRDYRSTGSIKCCKYSEGNGARPLPKEMVVSRVWSTRTFQREIVRRQLTTIKMEEREMHKAGFMQWNGRKEVNALGNPDANVDTSNFPLK
ncbi:hypothetical protein Tco_0784967 [Tanacetum coccineum]